MVCVYVRLLDVIFGGCNKNGNQFDRFSSRVIFPIHNLSGRVIGFGGRILKSEEKKAKFVYMHPIEDVTLQSNITQFIKYEVGSEEGVAALLAYTLLEDKELPEEIEDILEDLDIGYLSAESNVGEEELESMYELTKPSFKTIGDNLKLNVKLKNNQNPNDLLKLISQNSKVIHFKEVIPSANEIFINSVEND